MTKAQEIKIKAIQNEVMEDWVRPGYELKNWEVNENEYFVSVVVEVGLIGDEGTFASILARNHAHIFIGKNGGLTYPTKKGKIKRLKWINLWEVHLAQTI